MADASDAGLATASAIVALPTGFLIGSGGDFVLGVAVSGGRVATTNLGVTTVAEAANMGAGVAGEAASLATDVAELAAVSGGAPAGGAAAAGPPLRMISELCTEATGTNNLMQYAKLSGRWTMGEYMEMADNLAYYIKRLADYGIHNFDHLAN